MKAWLSGWFYGLQPRERWIVGRNRWAEALRQQRLIQSQGIGHGTNHEAGLQTGEVGQLGHERTVDDDQPPRTVVTEITCGQFAHLARTYQQDGGFIECGK